MQRNAMDLSFTVEPQTSVCLLMTATSLLAVVGPWEPCSTLGPTLPINCTIHEVRVVPCREAAREKPCRLKRGRNASISFDYTPNFSGEDLYAQAFWANGPVDIPFIGMQTEACNSTTCPATSGSRQSYNYNLELSRYFPRRDYDDKWKLWHTEGTDCCLVFKIKVSK